MINIIKHKFLNNKVKPLNNINELQDKVIVITGASRGIGKGIADTLINHQAILVLIARHKEELQNQFSNNKQVTLINADITKEIDVKKIVKIIQAKHKTVDVLINNVGMFNNKPIDEIKVTEFDTLVNTNLKGMFLMSQAILPFMKKRKKGIIINLGSKISHNTSIDKNKSLYALTKYAVEGFSYALNQELKTLGIKVTCLMPGTAQTFFSLRSKNFLKPQEIGEIIVMLIKMENVSFEGLIFTSVKQKF